MTKLPVKEFGTAPKSNWPVPLSVNAARSKAAAGPPLMPPVKVRTALDGPEFLKVPPAWPRIREFVKLEETAALAVSKALDAVDPRATTLEPNAVALTM